MDMKLKAIMCEAVGDYDVMRDNGTAVVVSPIGQEYVYHEPSLTGSSKRLFKLSVDDCPIKTQEPSLRTEEGFLACSECVNVKFVTEVV